MNYTTIPTKEIVEKTKNTLTENGIETIVVENSALALEKIKELIPQGVSVMNGSSTTLNQIGFVEYLKEGKHGWNNLHATILAEQDPEKQALLRKQSVLSDFYLGSVHGLTEDGEFVIGSNSGSQLPHIVFTSQHLIFVVSTNKIVPTLADALKRLEEYSLPLEDARAKSIGWGGSQLSKIVIWKKENAKMGRKVKMILVNEVLGY
jgi:L-lactate utilization protein LutC